MARARRLIFTVSPGRSGTRLLARLLSAAAGERCFHEPAPDFADAMRSAQAAPEVAAAFWRDAKLPAIDAHPGALYAETSHLFGKGFLEPLLELGVVPDVVLLTRPARAVARSLYRAATIPGRSEQGLRYCLAPGDPGVLPLPGWRDLHDYQLCFWYCLEMERRQTVYARRIAERGGRVLWISLAELTSRPGFERLRDFLDRPRRGPGPALRFAWLRRRRVGRKRRVRHPDPLPGSLAELEEALRARLRGASSASEAAPRQRGVG